MLAASGFYSDRFPERCASPFRVVLWQHSNLSRSHGKDATMIAKPTLAVLLALGGVRGQQHGSTARRGLARVPR